MLEVIASSENKITYIKANGRIDATNALEFETQAFAKVNESIPEAIVLDFEGLEYISSAGLRVILKLLKTCRNLSAINVNSEVFDILEMTGFSEMMNVTKAYKKVSVEGCEVIGTGANGKVYRIDDETIIKTYINPESLKDIQRERELAKTAFVLGVPTAISYDVVKVGDSYGSVFELLSARSFSKLFAVDDGKFDEYITLYVDLLKTIHSKKINHPMIPSMRETFIGDVKRIRECLPDDKYQKLLSMAESVEESDTLLHGDYHIKNVMMQKDEVLLIDMDTLCHGNPVFEFAAMHKSYIGYNFPCKEDRFFLGISNARCKEVFTSTIKKYFQGKTEEEIQVILDKISVVGFARMIKSSLKHKDEYYGTEASRKLYIDELLKVIDKVDSLSL